MQKYYWTPEKEDLLRQNYGAMNLHELAQMLGFSFYAVKLKAQKLKITRDKIWKPEEDDLLKELYYKGSWEELYAKLPKRTQRSIYARAGVLNLERVNTSRFGKGVSANKASQFKKGHIPMNKGKKQKDYMSPDSLARCEQTRFKKGNIPHNTQYDFAIRERKDKTGIRYLYIRLSKAHWVLLHRWIWEQKAGPIPKKHCIVFKDGNTANCEFSNLELITMKENLKRNSIHNYKAENPQLHKAIFSVIQLKKTITEIIKKK